MPYGDNCSPRRTELRREWTSSFSTGASRRAWRARAVTSTSHPLRRLRSCPSQRGDNAGSIARHTVSKWRSRRARNFFVLNEDVQRAVHLLTGSPVYQHSNPAVVISWHLNAPPPHARVAG